MGMKEEKEAPMALRGCFLHENCYVISAWTLTVMTDSVVLRSKDLALLRGGRVEGKSRP